MILGNDVYTRVMFSVVLSCVATRVPLPQHVERVVVGRLVSILENAKKMEARAQLCFLAEFGPESPWYIHHVQSVPTANSCRWMLVTLL